MRRKAIGQSSSIIKPTTQSSGISKTTLPKILPAPKYYNLYDIEPSLKNHFMYIIKHYGKVGLSVLIYRQPENDQVTVQCGDWQGASVDLSKKSDITTAATDFINKYLMVLLNAMKIIKLDQAQLFLALTNEGPMLVDMQVSINKLAGPGMIRDLFGKIIKTQEVTKIEILDDKVLEAIKNGSGSYEGDLILKPAKFKMYHEINNNVYRPMYAEVIR